MTIEVIRLDRERALRLARTVASWHRPDDDEGALDCFAGMVCGDLTEEDIKAIWQEAKTSPIPHLPGANRRYSPRRAER